ncbi:MAG: hypothetical protein ACFE9N_16310, partial [Promethearchaeota archaeon]
MPRAMILYEIDPSFGPNILGEYYLKQDEKIASNILKEFSEKHIKKEFGSVTIHKDNERYYSGKINGESINKDNLFLSFILREGEDILSLKSLFENIEERIIKDFSSDKQKMNEILKNGLNAISLAENIGIKAILEVCGIDDKSFEIEDAQRVIALFT